MHVGLGIEGSHLAIEKVANLGLDPKCRVRDRKLLGPYAITEPLNQSINAPGLPVGEIVTYLNV